MGLSEGRGTRKKGRRRARNPFFRLKLESFRTERHLLRAYQPSAVRPAGAEGPIEEQGAKPVAPGGIRVSGIRKNRTSLPMTDSESLIAAGFRR